jgi:hypothetical protein
MRHRSFSFALGLLIALLGLSPGVSATEPLRATLGGRPLSLAQVADHHCHDLDYPVINCFLTGRELDVAVAVHLRADRSSEVFDDLQAVSYARVYVDATFGGSSMVISRSYDNLGVIGWNDRISSFRTLTAGGGTFWQHAMATGWAYDFCCGSSVTYVGDYFNDQFSSVYPS